MQRPVVQLPDSTLTHRADPVIEITDTVRSVATDLVDTMRESGHSVGVAAPQIGWGLQMFCVDVTGHSKADSCHGEFLLVNPEILRATKPAVAREGCMSVPDLTGDVARPTEVVVQGLDINGNLRVLEVNAFEARAVLHEFDHLQGKLFLDRVVSADRVFRRRRYR